MQEKIKNRLTSTSKIRTMYVLAKWLRVMDATTKKMIDKMSELRREIEDRQRELRAIERTLELVGIRPEEPVPSGLEWDEIYSGSRPFSRTTLVDACKKILVDFQGARLTKSNVEYLASAGGYQFSTDDPRNSVEVTLRRLAADGFCQVKRGVGPHESEYWWERPPEQKQTS
jgi:hypothetical protein